MACGTGKTFTGLKIAEDLAGPGKFVLFLVPSLALMSQAVREWSLDTTTPLRAFAVCSDAQVGKRNKGSDDIGDIDVHDLAHPATTLAARVVPPAARLKTPNADPRRVSGARSATSWASTPGEGHVRAPERNSGESGWQARTEGEEQIRSYQAARR